ncbi:DNA-binding transcriptional regulator, AcrR family [Nakamurella panacisegetis]|uniref:DNA-binding transcriptional regulator, AcrR family n=1 Tax=Nakamurella panacisegetis TaxID=1090615 RepID=A0A1H0RBM9_9ACTN|nr:TetR/AcrR family transcriptional regulator [Nakamurella panacisegetis]SDP27022.1 DNA-binding transcriptional regulator, AcrR family [Nakamurella panacisegetis]
MSDAATRAVPAGSPLRGAAREQAILDAVIELIGEVGYEKVTIDAIAARARSSKTTMYRRWAGKAGIVADALSRRAQGSEPEVPDTGSLRQDLLATVRQIAQTLVGRQGPSLIGLLEAIRDDATLRDLIGSQVTERSHSVGRTICARARSRGEKVDVHRSDVVLELAFAQVFTETLFHGGVPDAPVLERLVDHVLLPLLQRSV